MAKMKTLTVSGQTYTVNDPEAVSFCTKQALTSLQQQIARENIGACTVEQTADRLCPPFSEADTVVVCRPVEGSALAVVSRIVPRQDGTGDPSPDNIRPISGHTAVKLTHCGKNLFDITKAKSEMATIVGNTIRVTKNASGGRSSGSVPLRIPSNTNFTLSGKFLGTNGTTTNPWTLFCVTESGKYHGVTQSDVATDGSFRWSRTFTEAITRCYIQVEVGEEAGVYVEFTDLQIEFGSKTDYEPYKGGTFILDLGQTIYGGCLDWATGLLTVDRAFKTLTGDGIGIYVEALDPSTRITIQGCTSNGEVQGSACNHLSSHFKTHHGNHSADIPFWSIGGNKGVSRCWLYCDPAVVGTDTAGVNAWLKAQYDAGTPVQVSYKLAEPITVQLTPQEIHALSGENILYSDTGDTTVTGKADPGAIIEKLTNAIIALGGNV